MRTSSGYQARIPPSPDALMAPRRMVSLSGSRNELIRPPCTQNHILYIISRARPSGSGSEDLFHDLSARDFLENKLRLSVRHDFPLDELVILVESGAGSRLRGGFPSAPGAQRHRLPGPGAHRAIAGVHD